MHNGRIHHNHRIAPTRLLIVRHGETEWNREGRIQGHVQTPLSATGRNQAELLRHRLRDEQLAAVYTSDLERSVETATIAATGHDLDPVPLVELRECSYGEWEGLLSHEVVQRYADAWRLRREDPVNHAPPGGESLPAVQARVIDTLRRLATVHPGESVLVVTHGGAIRALVCHLTGRDLRTYWDMDVGNCSLTIVEATADDLTLITVNDCGHLTSAEC